jgi:ribonuclease HI
MVDTSGSIIHIYTDGACDPNPGRGGWGVVIHDNGNQRTLSGGEPRTTNNRMELTAAIQGLRAISSPARIIVYCDSEYVRKGITQWMAAWKRLNWQRKTGELANVELWKELDRWNCYHTVTWRWVRGHAGNPGNELADRLAVQARQKLR